MGTVMSRLYRARQQLQQDLEPYALKEGYIAAA
jgi:DNA-directed RNA polymerase specialized sigma24 family protein